ncbi:MAG: cupredoxin domain-containing protein [Frankiaceae bacterium]|nr:cupredoxin domain-containing protein [Frankiaceae bacterium]
MRRAGAVAPLAALALVIAACGSGSSGGPSSVGSGASNSPTIAGLHANNHGTADVTGKSSVNIEADNYYFEPSVLKGTPGQQLTLHVVNATGTGHNLTVEPQHVNKDLDAHGKADLSVTLPASGVLAFWCEYHKSLGMVGGLLVSGSAGGASPAPTSAPSSSGSSGGGYGGYGHG